MDAYLQAQRSKGALISRSWKPPETSENGGNEQAN